MSHGLTINETIYLNLLSLVKATFLKLKMLLAFLH